MKFTPTDEQQDIFDCELSGNKIIKIIAFAGTGKTTTLREYSKIHSDKKILYLAFNRSVKEEAKKEFPSNVTCHTSHSLAFGKVMHKYQNKFSHNLKTIQGIQRIRP